MATPGYKKTRASSLTGKNAPKKHDGYARTSPHPSAIGTKNGLTKDAGYSGPNVVKPPERW